MGDENIAELILCGYHVEAFMCVQGEGERSALLESRQTCWPSIGGYSAILCQSFLAGTGQAFAPKGMLLWHHC